MARLFDDANNEYLKLASILGFSDYPVSFACWFAPDASLDQMLVCLGTTNTPYYIGIRGRNPGDTDIIAHVSTAAGSEFAGSSAQYATDSSWQHACGVFATSTSRAVYLDGGNKGTDVDLLAFPPDINECVIGAYRTVTAPLLGPFSGSICEVAIWNVALTDAEVLILAAGYSPLFVHPQNLVAYWPLVRGLNDKVGGYNLTAFSGDSGPVVSPHSSIIYPAAPYIITAPAAVGATLLEPNACGHAHSGAQPGIKANFLCAPNTGTHAHSAGTVATPVQWLLDIANAAHAHSAGTVTAAIQWLLNPANASHAHASAAADVFVQWLLSFDNATHAHSATSVVLTVFGVVLLSPNNAAHAHSVTTEALKAMFVLGIDNAAHALSSTQPGFIANYLCDPNNAVHAHVTSTVDVDVHWLLNPANAAHVHTATAEDMKALFLLEVDNAVHAHAVTSPAASALFKLLINNAAHAHTADDVATIIWWLLDPLNAAHAHDATSVVVTLPAAYLLSPDGAVHILSSTSPLLSILPLLSDHRLIIVPAELRFVDVDAETRIITVPEEDRFIAAA